LNKLKLEEYIYSIKDDEIKLLINIWKSTTVL
jgi:hypothetical protein